MAVRIELERLMRATLADRRNWTYAFWRPLAVPTTWSPGQHVYADCSHAMKLLCKWAGAPDPMGTGWSTWGNSTTLAANLPHLLSPAAMHVGDIVTFGVDGTKHAAMVLEPGLDPLLWSHGHQGAPNTYRLSEDVRVHQLLRIPVPVSDVPTPAMLRSKVGYWNWLKWTLAEGEWKTYGKFNRTVRPNVPRWIPASWWMARRRFLANRTKGNQPTTPPKDTT